MAEHLTYGLTTKQIYEIFSNQEIEQIGGWVLGKFYVGVPKTVVCHPSEQIGFAWGIVVKHLIK